MRAPSVKEVAKRAARPAAILAAISTGCLLVVSCATYQTKVEDARKALKAGDAEKAVKLLQPLAAEESKDQLVYMLDYATALQSAHQYQESASEFQRAQKVADLQDYHSISNIAAAALTSETMIQYKGDNFEKVMINGLNALNYLELGSLDDALVEAKLLNQKLYKMKNEGGANYDQNPYAFYLSAMIWEAEKKWDDAYIDYKRVYDLEPSFPYLHADLVRSAMKAQRTDELSEWKKAFPEIKPAAEWNDNEYGEVVMIFSQGWGPRKQPRPRAPKFPHLLAVNSITQRARLEVEPVSNAAPTAASAAEVANGNTVGIAAFTAKTETLFNVEKVAIKTLDDDFGRLIASRVGGTVAKDVVADQIRQKNEALGMIAWVAMKASDQADLRQWSTLPQTLQVARIRVRPGRYKVRAIGLVGNGFPSGEQLPDRDVQIKAGQKFFFNWRSLQ